ncbi:aminomethyltransferase family protein [Marvinbryantia formatexigens]|nr:aminomethyltransferase family protein [Marvinbryantia formatexigens]UWO25755.1 aminomethyltransferase family protein [Marvinbryantia formatexigens DSM 14469]SDF35768.1 aminomethyltransferase [Marvinbryantia formatexigens]
MLLISTDESCRHQHEVIRNTVGVYYFTHRLIEVTGADALVLLERLYPCRISKLDITKGKYTMLLTEEGIPQDDCVITRQGETTYWISTLHVPRIMREMENASDGLDAKWEEITKKIDMYAVQGPRAEEMVEQLLEVNPHGQKRFQMVENRLGDIQIKAAKGGYTGEKGYEIYCDVKDTEAVKQMLCAEVGKYGGEFVDEFDVIAYTLATEAGLYLVTDFDDATPFETGMDWMIDWTKEEFLGRDAVLAAKDQPMKKKLVGITVDDPNVKVHGGPYGAVVSKNGKEIGRVTKFTYGFTVGKWVGMALINAGSAETGEHVTLDWDVDAVVTERKFI